MIWLMAALILICALLGTPLFVVILAAAMLGFYATGTDLQVIAIELYRLADTPLLPALPLFAFAGCLLAESNASKRLVRLTQAIFGPVRSGVAIVTLCACAFFTALTGASGVTIVALGGLLYPALVATGHDERFSLGLVTSSGSLGLLLAPSLPLILYGVIVQQMDIAQHLKFSIQELFLAGILPACLMIMLLTAWSFWANRNRDIHVKFLQFAEIRAAFWDARWELPLPLVVLGGVFSGFFVLSEAAAVTVIYVLVTEMLLYREISLQAMLRVAGETVRMVGGILLILGVALAFTNLLVDQEIPRLLFEVIREYIDSKLVFLILINVLLLGLGAILDIFSALVIMTPLLLPIALEYGVHPVHLGIIFLANMQIGYFTPPVGMNLFIASYRFGRPLAELYRACIPFMLVLILALLLITYVPWFSLVFIT